ncbi:MAG: J domain-containing protein [Desulfobulbus sp.]|nr:J domain-containing protein [Desulfobulbus sp.]
MNAKQWQAIEKARKVLRLGERATLAEIKRSYRRLSKLYHPDTAESQTDEGREKMYELTAAYELLMQYCNEYRFPLHRDDEDLDELDLYDPEDWWRARFGRDPVWSGRRKRKR